MREGLSLSSTLKGRNNWQIGQTKTAAAYIQKPNNAYVVYLFMRKLKTAKSIIKLEVKSEGLITCHTVPNFHLGTSRNDLPNV